MGDKGMLTLLASVCLNQCKINRYESFFFTSTDLEIYLALTLVNVQYLAKWK